MNDKIKVIIISGDCTGLVRAIASGFNEKFAQTEGANSTEGKKDFKVDLEVLHEVLNPTPATNEYLMEISAMPDPLARIVIKDEKPLANMGAYRGYKSHPTKASDRKRFERFNKKRR